MQDLSVKGFISVEFEGLDHNAWVKQSWMTQREKFPPPVRLNQNNKEKRSWDLGMSGWEWCASNTSCVFCATSKAFDNYEPSKTSDTSEGSYTSETSDNSETCKTSEPCDASEFV